ncbi:MAG: hypothetical protein G01um1014106_111 [Parcubacteria group bacterium Gr01-1014_106]|nr:MAG: hypothetical protein G01um1014106_111 [Parcubacteria group bacterium Gr01-1014_106]
MKRVICCIGYPGAGKTTLATTIQRALGCHAYHVPEVVGHLLSPHVRRNFRNFGRLYPDTLHAAFLDHVAQDPHHAAILDNFPLCPRHAHLLKRYQRKHGWSVEFLFLHVPPFPGVAVTLGRQFIRDLREKKTPLLRIFWKAMRGLVYLPATVQCARALGFPVHVLNATHAPHDVEEHARACLGLSLQDMPWDREVLQILADVAPDAWVVGGSHVYKPFFNGVFGPLTPSWDVDIKVGGMERAKTIQHTLDVHAPHIRWHVKDAFSWAVRECGRTIRTVEECIGCMCLICTCVGIRWRNNRVDVHWGHPEAETDLRNGILRPHPQGQRGFARDKATKIAMYYPGVSAPMIGHERVPITRTFPETMAQIRALERGGRRQWNTLTVAERERAERILAMRARLPCMPHVVPWPSPAPLPETDPWYAPDARFRAWVANQTRSRNPVGGRDPYLAAALAYQNGVAQKPTHQGWSMHLHAMHTLLQIDTDALPAFRRPLRLAALWHDVGKVCGIRTPGAHPATGAKLWRKVECHPFPAVPLEETRLISFLIANHDIVGRLERGLWDETYQGAMDPTAVRTELSRSGYPLSLAARLTKEMWRADVGSVSLLRWLLPLADPLEELILCGSS